MKKIKQLRKLTLTICVMLIAACLSVIGFMAPANSGLSANLTVSAATSAPVAYDGKPINPPQINASNYRLLGLSDEDWAQFDGFYAIRNAKELYGYAGLIAKQYTGSLNAVLLDNIVVNESVSADGATYTWTPMKGTAIGNYHVDHFTGTFDGNGYYISGLYVNVDDGYDAGFIETVSKGGVVRNLTIKNSYFKASIRGAGSIAAANFGLIEYCRIESDVTVTAVHGIGGIVGEVSYYYPPNDKLYKGSLKYSHSAANVVSTGKGTYYDIGGLAGYAEYDSLISYCTYIKGRISTAASVQYSGCGGKGSSSVNSNGETIFTPPQLFDTPRYFQGYNSESEAHNCAAMRHVQVAGVCEEGGLTAYTSCVTCGKLLSGEKKPISIHLSDSTHYRAVTGDTAKHEIAYDCCDKTKETEAHVYNNEVCSLCGFESIVYNGEDGRINGKSLTLTSDLVIPEGKTLYIDSDVSLNVPVGVKLTVNGKVVNGGNVKNEGGIYVNGEFVNNGKIDCAVNAPSHAVFTDEGFCAICGSFEYPQDAKLVNGVYQIGNKGQLLWFSRFVSAGNVNANAVLTKDITFNSGNLANLTAPSNQYTEWEPIGRKENSNGSNAAAVYNGTFDGQGHTIYGLYFENEFTYSANAGLFGIVSGTIKNVTVANSWMVGASYVGGIVGELQGGRIENCHFENGFIGGAAYSGGITGYIHGGAKVINSTNSSKIAYYKVNTGISFNTISLGGISGQNRGLIEDCVNSGTVEGGDAGQIGGISGEVLDGDIRSSINVGAISGSIYVGGVTGWNYNGGIYDSISIGAITCKNKTLWGGIVGGANSNYVLSGNYYHAEKAVGLISNNSSVYITLEQFYGGELAYNLGFGQLLNGSSIPSKTAPTVYRYYDSNHQIAYTNDENFVCQHGGGVASCLQKAVCSVCGNEYGDFDYTNHLDGGSHRYELNENDTATHNIIHECGYVDLEEVHTFINGVCEKCNAVCGVDCEHEFDTYRNFCKNCEEGYVAPTLSADGYYEITNYSNLFWFAQQVNAGNNAINARLVKGISFSGNNRPWIPIGRTEIGENAVGGYAGVFDGNGYWIDLFYNYSAPVENTTYGIFGTLAEGAVIKNLQISNFTFKNSSVEIRIGALAGQTMPGSLISNCFVDGVSITAERRIAGGMVGLHMGTIKNSFTYDVELVGQEGRVGGITGDWAQGTIINSYTTYPSLGSTARNQFGTAEGSEAGVSELRFEIGEIAYLLNQGLEEGYREFLHDVGRMDCPRFYSAGNVYLKQYGDVAVYLNNLDDPILNYNLTVEEGQTMVIASSEILEIKLNVTLTVNGILLCDGVLNGSGVLSGNGIFAHGNIHENTFTVLNSFLYDGNDYTEELEARLKYPTRTQLGVTFIPYGWEYVKNFETVKNAGEYIVTLTNGEIEYTKSFTISPIALSDEMISLEYTSCLYNGQNEPEILIDSELVPLKGEDYDVVYEYEFPIGTPYSYGRATVTFKRNFTGEFYREFDITNAVIGETATIDVDLSTRYLLNGSVEPEVTVWVGDVKLTRDLEYEVIYTDCHRVGTAEIFVRALDHGLDGYETFYFEIKKPVITVTTEPQSVVVANYDDAVFDNSKYTAEGLIEGHTVILGQDYNNHVVRIEQILDENGENVLYDYEVIYLSQGECHIFRDIWYSDYATAEHWHPCFKVTCEEVYGRESCHGGEATCAKGAICEDCGIEYTSSTGMHNRIEGVCVDCGNESSAQVWVDENNDGLFNGSEPGYQFISWAVNAGASFKAIKDFDDYGGGVGADNVNSVFDINGKNIVLKAFSLQQGTNCTITITDSSIGKTGRLDTWLVNHSAENLLILDNFNFGGSVAAYGGGVIRINNTNISELTNNGTVYFNEGYDLYSFTYSGEGTVYVGERLVTFDSATNTWYCGDEGHKMLEATCSHPYTCAYCSYSEGESVAHRLGSEATCESAQVCLDCGMVVVPALGHEYIVVITGQDCVNDGVAISTCLVCGESVEEIALALGHEYESVVTEPTCEEDGYTTHTCLNCGKVIVDSIIEVTGEHLYESVVTLPECDKGGYTTHTCLKCGEVIINSTTEALGHDYSYVENKATCETAGSFVYTCTVCAHSYTEEVEPLGHSYESVVTSPDCENEGYTTHTCLNCGGIVVDIHTEALGHSYESVVTLPDCENGGFTTHTCLVCGGVVVDSHTEALGHSYESVITPVTCTEAGYTTHTCLVCGDSYVDNVIYPEHKYASVVTSPDCLNEGYTTYTCLVCGDSYVGNNLPALGHTEVVDDAVKPNCLNTGLTEGKHCSVCGEVITAQEVVPALGHTEIVDMAVDATCTQNGLTEGKHCSVCGEITAIQEGVPATPHNVVTSKSVAPTCGETGLTEGSFCLECGEIFVAQEVIPALGHTEVIDGGTRATCTQEGLTEGSHCLNCGEVVIAQEVIPALGHTVNDDGDCTTAVNCSSCGETVIDAKEAHDFGDWIVDKAPTESEVGVKIRTCDCGHVERAEIPVLEASSSEEVIEENNKGCAGVIGGVSGGIAVLLGVVAVFLKKRR